MATKKPNLETHSSPCCGECKHYGRDTDGISKCFVNPPCFAGYNGEDEMWVSGAPKDSRSIVCKEYNRRMM